MSKSDDNENMNNNAGFWSDVFGHHYHDPLCEVSLPVVVTWDVLNFVLNLKFSD